MSQICYCDKKYDKMKIRIVIVLFILINVKSFAQVGIGTHTPDPSTVLDITAIDRGVLFPRISLNDVTDASLDGANTAADGLMIYNTNASVTGGDGVGYYMFNGSNWNKILTSDINLNDHDWYIELTTDTPTDINDDIYTMGNVGIGKNNPTASLHIVSVDGITNTGVRSEFSGSDNNQKIGFWSRLTQTGDGVHYGVKNDIGSGDGSHYGSYNGLGGNGNGKHYGTYNFINNSGTEWHYGTYNLLQSAGNGLKYGVFNELRISGSGAQYANYNNFWNLGSGDQYGLYNDYDYTQNVHRKRYGVYNLFNIQGTGTQYGSYSQFQSTGNGEIYGSFNKITNSGTTASHYGVRNEMSGGGVTRTGTNYGVMQLINDSGGTGTQYGVYNNIAGIGSSLKYGSYNFILNTAGGTHYAVYAEAEKTGSWAGYFVGDVYASSKIGIGITAPARSLHISDVMRLEPIGIVPTAPSTGDMYMDDGTNTGGNPKLRVYDGTVWQDLW